MQFSVSFLAYFNYLGASGTRIGGRHSEFENLNAELSAGQEILGNEVLFSFFNFELFKGFVASDWIEANQTANMDRWYNSPLHQRVDRSLGHAVTDSDLLLCP
jgi:hypothetical protein